MMEGEADYKAELADLAKDGNYFLYFFSFYFASSLSAYLKRLDWECLLLPNSMLMLELRQPLIFVGDKVILISERTTNRY